MRNNTREKIRGIFKAGDGLAKTSRLLDNGVQMRQIAELISNGEIIRVKNGVYSWQGLAEGKDMVYRTAAMIVPKGIICLSTALAYHGLTSENPWEISMAVPRNYNVKLADYPPIRMYTFNDKMHGLGTMKVGSGDNSFSIYDTEKTICDAVKFEKYIGTGAVKEAIRTYVRDRSMNLDLLMKYARICGVEQKVKIRVEMVL